MSDHSEAAGVVPEAQPNHLEAPGRGGTGVSLFHEGGSMQITKLQHEKLLAAIKHAKDDTMSNYLAMEREKKRADEAEENYKHANEIAVEFKKQLEEEREERKILVAQVAGRNEALVQLSLRIAEYGDPSTARLSFSSPEAA